MGESSGNIKNQNKSQREAKQNMCGIKEKKDESSKTWGVWQMTLKKNKTQSDY